MYGTAEISTGEQRNAIQNQQRKHPNVQYITKTDQILRL